MLYIFIASEKDERFLGLGLEFLETKSVEYKTITGSTHLQFYPTKTKIEGVLQRKPKVLIAGAATATGLPGIIAGMAISVDTVVLGVRFIENPGPKIIEDATFNLSSQPTGAPLAYCGFNEKGFLHACMMAVKILRQ